MKHFKNLDGYEPREEPATRSKPGSPIVRKLVNRLAHNQDGKCYWCKRRGLKLTFDHIVPSCQGGMYTIANGVAACAKCNNMRGSMDFGKFGQMNANA